MSLDKLQRYRPAVLAEQFAQEKNSTASTGALEKLVGTIELGEDGLDAFNYLRKDPNGEEIITSIYSGKYNKILGDSKIGDLFGFYKSYFDKYLDEESCKRAEAEFKSIDEKYSDIKDKIIGAQEILSSKRQNISDDEKEVAKNTLRKYGKIMLPLSKFENFELNKLRDPIDEEAFKKDLAEMYKPATPETSS